MVKVRYKKLIYDEVVDDEMIFRPAKTIKKIVRVPLVDEKSKNID